MPNAAFDQLVSKRGTQTAETAICAQKTVQIMKVTGQAWGFDEYYSLPGRIAIIISSVHSRCFNQCWLLRIPLYS